MQFNDIKSWLIFITDVIHEKQDNIHEYLDLHNLIKDFKKEAIDSGVISGIFKKLYNNTEIESDFWSEVLFWIKEESIPDDIINDFIKRKIATETLAHLNLDDQFLLKLCDDVEEALLTIGKRMYFKEYYSLTDFNIFLDKHKSSYILYKFLINLNSSDIEKKEQLIKHILNETEFEDLKELIEQENIAVQLKETDNLDIILKYMDSHNGRYILSIANNKNTPVEVLKKLILIDKIKFAKKIRHAANQNFNGRNKK